MILTTISSGMGNQMFQYAAGFGLARLRGVGLCLDLDFYADNKQRRYELGRLSITGRPMSVIDRLRLARSSDKPAGSLKGKIARLLPLTPLHRVVDRQQGFDPTLLQQPDHTRLYGYWQNAGYFAHCEAELRREFKFTAEPDSTNAEMLLRIRRQPSVCVHVRRGDYLKPGEVVGPCGLDYYGRALSAMAEAVPAAHYFVFSDDPEWARANLRLPGQATFVTHNTGVNDPEDLRLMAACDHFIIANSTFSWWGAWLGEVKGKRVIAPARWFKAAHGDEPHIVPPQWARL